MLKIPKQLQTLCNQWEHDLKGDMLENIEDEIEIHKTIKNFIIHIVNVDFSLWIAEADNDNKEIYIEYQTKFRNIIEVLWYEL